MAGGDLKRSVNHLSVTQVPKIQGAIDLEIIDLYLAAVYYIKSYL